MKTFLYCCLVCSSLSGACQSVNELLAEFESAPHDSTRLRASLSLVRQLMGKNERKAKDVAVQALEYLEATSNLRHRIMALQNAGERYWEDGEYDTAIYYERRAINLARQISDHYLVGFSYHSIGLDYYYTSTYDSALHYYDLAKKEMVLANDSLYLSRLENHIGLVYDQMGDFTRAVDQLLLSMRQQEKQPGYISGAYPLESSQAQDDSVFYHLRIDKNKRDLQYELANGTTFKVAQAYRGIGQDYMTLQQYDSAIHNFRAAASHYLQADYDPFYEDIGAAFEALGSYDSAEFYFLKRYNLTSAHGLRIGLSKCYFSLAGLARKQERYDESLSYFKQALAINEWMGNRRAVITVKLDMADLYLQLNDPYAAARLANEALGLSLEIKALPAQAKAYEALYRINSHLRRYRESLSALEKADSLKAKLTEGRMKLETAKLTLGYERELKDVELQELKEARLLQEEKIKNRNLAITLATILTVVAVAIASRIYRQFRKKKESTDILSKQNAIIEQQNSVLQSQNKEKEMLLSEVHHRVKNNLQIISSLINLKSREASAETRQTLTQLNGRVFSMGLIHERLYQSENIQSLRADLYLEELSQYLVQSFAVHDRSVALAFAAQPVELDADRTLACGLICNELLTNSLKHGFEVGQKEFGVWIRMETPGDTVEWAMGDNGKKAKATSEPVAKSFGLHFVDQLVTSKLAGTWSMDVQNGCVIRITFPRTRNGKN